MAPATSLSKFFFSSLPGLPQIVSVDTADLDGDGDTDICFSISLGVIIWFENDGSGGFTEEFFLASARASRIFLADVDGDGHIDILATGTADNAAYWYKNDGAPDPIFTRIEIGVTGANPTAIYPGDLDGDGDLDIVTSSRTGNRVEWFESISANSGDFDGDGDVDGRDFLAWQRGASPKPLAGDDLADWQATYGYTAPEAPARLSGDGVSPEATSAAVAAIDEMLAGTQDTPTAHGFILPPVSTAQVSRPNKVPSRPVTHLYYDRVFAELGVPSRTYVRDFGDIVTRRDVAKRPLLAISGLDE